MDDPKIIELRDLINKIVYSLTKANAKPYISRLRILEADIKNNIDPYLSGKLDEVIADADKASGRVKDKEHWVSCAEVSLQVFENEYRRNKKQ